MWGICVASVKFCNLAPNPPSRPPPPPPNHAHACTHLPPPRVSPLLGPAAIVVVGLSALLDLVQVVQMLQAEDGLLRAVGVRRV